MPQSREPRLILVEPDDKHAVYHEFLISDEGMDKVHCLPNGSERQVLLEKRLGLRNHNKRTYALVGDNMQVLSVIYTIAVNAPKQEETWRMLPGKIDPILEEDSKPIDYDPSVITFYSISSFGMRGAGASLIKSLYRAFIDATHTPILTTLSPLRTFANHMQGRAFLGSDEAKIAEVVQYLKSGVDPVQKFHLGNGAQVGAIHLNASVNTPDAPDGLGVMISYRYPRRIERLDENQKIWNRGKEGGRVPASYHLAHMFK